MGFLWTILIDRKRRHQFHNKNAIVIGDIKKGIKTRKGASHSINMKKVIP